MQVNAILHYHVNKCMKNASSDEYSQGIQCNKFETNYYTSQNQNIYFKLKACLHFRSH